MSSPGGAYSNLLCSMFNADLALSVAMSACSTLAAVIFLPFNIFLYVGVVLGLDDDVKLDWSGLLQTIAAVEGGVAMGAFISYKIEQPARNRSLSKLELSSSKRSLPNNIESGEHDTSIEDSQRDENRDKWSKRFTAFGNSCGVLLLIISISVSESSDEGGLSSTDPLFYLTCFLPILFAGITSLSMSSLAKLPKPTRLAIAVETMYQNTSISTGVALSSFASDVARVAVGVGVVNGLFQFVCSAGVLVVGWKAGWSYADTNAGFCKFLLSNYQR
eukprot:augustus_masked-scaffold_27-processed-gene-1.13-mRNA-1 protein AED:1.00 eAED:1.00 QI:0/-1/0/0/-1/1/1/0/274